MKDERPLLNSLNKVLSKDFIRKYQMGIEEGLGA